MKVEQDLDILWSSIGSFGKWQMRMMFFMSIVAFFGAIHDFDYIYIAAEPEHWCHTPQLDNLNWTTEQIKNISIPRNTIHHKGEFSSCEFYVRNYTELSNITFDKVSESHSISFENDLLRAPCSSWTYDTSIYKSTLVSEWNLVCDRIAMMSTVQSVYLCGILFSSIICGMLSDKFGRRPVFRICLLLWVLVAIIEAFVYDYFSYVIFRFVLAFFAQGSYLVGYVLITEICGSSHRGIIGMLYHVPFSIGFMAIPGVAYFIRDWRYLQYIFSFTNVIALVCFWFVPESPRWLIINGKTEQAKKILSDAAKVNGRNLLEGDVEDIIDKVQKTNVRNAISREIPTETSCEKKVCLISLKLFSLIRTKEMRKRTLVSYFGWFAVSLLYYGLALNGIHLPFNPYLVTFIMAAVEIPGILISIPLINKFGRKNMTAATFIIASISCLLQMAPPEDMGWLITLFATVAKLCVTSTFSIIYLYEAELFPTEVRNMAIGGASIFARFGGIASPYIIDLLGSRSSSYPFIIFGVTGLIAGVSTLLLPETNKKKLPETIDEVERRRSIRIHVET